MIKDLFDKLFRIYIVIWITVRITRIVGYPIPLINSYLTDIIAIPTMAHLMIIITRKFIVKKKDYTYPLSYLLILALYTSFICEFIAPKKFTSNTSDINDVYCYFFGAFFYYFIHRPCTLKPERD